MKNRKYQIIGALVVGLLFGHFCVDYAQNSQPRTQSVTSSSYSFGDFESVNLFNGKLNFKLPLVSISGRGSLSTSINLTISQKWDISGYSPYGYSVYTTPDSMVNAGLGQLETESVGFNWHETNPMTCGATEYEPSEATFSFKFTDSDGVTHILRSGTGGPIEVPYCHPGTVGTNLGREFVSWDGDGIKFVADMPVYFNGSGSVMRASSSSPPQAVTGLILYPNGIRLRVDPTQAIVWMEDRNGNRVTFSETYTSSSYYRTITDNLGRQVNIYFNQNESPYGNHWKIVYKGSEGTERTIRVSNSGGVVSDVWLPDGRRYHFSYTAYYELNRIETPQGAVIEYDYSGDVPSSPLPPGSSRPAPPFRRVAERRLFQEMGVLTNRTIYTYTNTSSNSTTQVDALDPGNNLVSRSKHYFHGDPTPIPSDEFTYDNAVALEQKRWNEGKEYSTEVFSTGGSLLRKKDILWEPNGSVNWGSDIINRNPRISSETSTLTDSGQVNKTVFQYADDPIRNTMTDSYVYDFGYNQPGQLLRRNHTDYVSYEDFSSNLYLLNLPAETWVSSDASGNNIISRTKYEYDNYLANANYAPLVDRQSITGHNSSYGTSFATRGNVTKVTSYADVHNETGEVSTYSQYDILGNVVKVFDAKGNASTIDYTDRFGSPDGEARSNSAPSALNGQQTFAFATSATKADYTTYAQFDYWTGSVVDAEDIIGNVNSTFRNDSLDRPTQTISANNRPQFRRQSSIIYDDVNRKVTVTGDSKAFNDNLIKSEAFYDGLGRTTEARTYEDANISVRILSEYDSLGRAYKTSTPHRPDLNEQPQWTTTTFDSLGRTTQIKTPDNGIVSRAYTGTTTTVTDQAGRKRRGVSDGLGRLLKVIEDPDGLNYETNYTYDVLGRLRKTTQTEGAVTQNRYFMYDDLGRLIRAKQTEQSVNADLDIADSVTGHSGWSVKYEYDANGNITSTTDANNRTITGTYDNFNRLTFRDYSDPTMPDVTFTFDDPNISNSKGNLTRVSTSISATNYTSFDELGRIRSSKQTTNGTEYNFPDYRYDFSGALVSQTYPSGRVVEVETDQVGRLSKVASQIPSQVERTYLSNVAYTSFGAVNYARLGNGRWESKQFDIKTLQTKQIQLGASANDSGLLKIEYDFGTTDNNGSLRQQKITVPGAASPIIQNYAYDALNRLESATEMVNSQVQWKQTFSYDRFGNRTFDATNTTTLVANDGVYNPQIDPATNKFTVAEGYNYDSEGNLTSNPVNQLFAYDAENRIKQFQSTVSQQTARYFYDGSGKRVRKLVGNEETVFVYDAFGKLVAEYSTVIENRPKIVNYLTTDDLGSARVVTDQTGQVVARHDYMPFGEEVLSGTGGRTATQGYGGNDGVRKQFTGYERDSESGLDYAQARYFKSDFGRFTSVDPIAASANIKNPQTLNRYTYALNSPYKFTDPLGLAPVQHCWAGICSTYAADEQADLVAKKKGCPPETKKDCYIDVDGVEKSGAIQVGDGGEKKPWWKRWFGGYGRAAGAIAQTPEVIGGALTRGFRGTLRGLGFDRGTWNPPTPTDSTAGDSTGGDSGGGGSDSAGGDAVAQAVAIALAYARMKLNDLINGKEYNGIVYRGGSDSNTNLAPRVDDVDGLSTFTKVEKATDPGKKYQAIDTSKLGAGLVAIKKGDHVSIRPRSATDLAIWMLSRGNDSPYTQAVDNAIVVRNARRPK